MRCKQGDLAVITTCPPVPEAVGKIVRCVRFHGQETIHDIPYPDVWELEWGDNQVESAWPWRGWGCRDAWMRPIRDPGEDAVDETLQAVPCEA